MVYNTAGEAVDVTKEYKQQVDSILKKYDKVKREVSEFKNENESLIRKVAELESKLSKFQYASKALALNKQLHQQVDTQQVQIDELSAKLAELKDENEMLKEIAQSEPPASVSYQNKPKAIVYFGLENPDLEQEFKKQEIEFITLSPFTKPDHIPEGFIVINVDFAKHTVWEVIKYHKPIIVTGSNGKLLSEKILAFCG
jgi:predicted RNase H-like nuclease (RuvC/YqgF family)